MPKFRHIIKKKKIKERKVYLVSVVKSETTISVKIKKIGITMPKYFQ